MLPLVHCHHLCVPNAVLEGKGLCFLLFSRCAREARSGTAPDRFRYQFKIIDYGLANFDETYACGPDLFVEEVC